MPALLLCHEVTQQRRDGGGKEVCFEYYCNGDYMFAYLQGFASFPVKNPRIDILGFAGQMVSVATAQPRCCNIKAVLDTM